MQPQRIAHVIVLLQPGGEVTRTYTEYETVKEAIEGLCEIYEQNAKTEDGMTHVDYQVGDVVCYFKEYEEVMFLIYDEELANYVPNDHDWVIEKIQAMGEAF